MHGKHLMLTVGAALHCPPVLTMRHREKDHQIKLGADDSWNSNSLLKTWHQVTSWHFGAFCCHCFDATRLHLDCPWIQASSPESSVADAKESFSLIPHWHH